MNKTKISGAQKTVMKTLDDMINHFEKYKNKKPERIGLDESAFRIFLQHQQNSLVKHKFVEDEINPCVYRDVEIYSVRAAK